MKESQRSAGRGVSQGCAAPCCPLPWDGVGREHSEDSPALLEAGSHKAKKQLFTFPGSLE